MAGISIDGKKYDVEDGLTIIQACEQVGVEIPRFCYHEKLKIAGNCRMCLVEVEKSPKPVASCSIPVADGMIVKTQSEMVKNAREGVMEFLLINHPLDCPICDQGGECDLQDQAMKYGRGKSRYHEEKRAVKDKYMGPLIGTHMTRCIHCTRCVRFLEDIAGTTELGAVGRGENMEITTYIEKSITSEISGNIIDLCPVGALTSKPYAFTARSWELHHTYSIDTLDAVGSHIRVDTRGNEVMRILPQAFQPINEEWISDKARFSYDGLKYQRLDTPLLRQNDVFSSTTWENAIKETVDAIRGKKIAIIAGKLTDVETMFAAKKFVEALGHGYCDHECNMHAFANEKNRNSYIFNSTIAGIEEADHCLLINTNPRMEAAILNARIRKAFVNSHIQISFIGPKVDLNYPYEHLGDDYLKIMQQMADGSHPYCKILRSAKKPILIAGSSMFEDDILLLNLYKKIAQKNEVVKSDWNGFNILHHNASAVGALDTGFVNYKYGDNSISVNDAEVLILLGADDFEIPEGKGQKIIYVGHHGDNNIYNADIVLPGSAYTEKSSTYVNLEGRVQRTTQAVVPPHLAKNDFEIIINIANEFGVDIGFRSIVSLRDKLSEENNIFTEANLFKICKNDRDLEVKDITVATTGQEIDKRKFIKYPLLDFYATDSISRNSRTMSKCSKEIFGEKVN